MTRLIAWFVDNSVAANLLMAVLLVGGVMNLMTIRQEEFPSIDTEIVQVMVEYPGATPAEVEEAVCVRVEEAIDGTPGIDRHSTNAVEGVCVIMVELVEGTDTSWALGEIESRVDGITTFPDEAERPVVTYLVLKDRVMQLAISGEADERALKVIGQRVRDEVADLPSVSQATLDYVRPYEISIEVSEYALQRHGLSFDRVAAAVRNASLDLPGGSIKTAGGEILLRSQGQAYRGDEFESIVVLTRPDGTTVRLGDIGKVVDGFEDADLRALFDGKPAVFVSVQRVGEEDMLEIADEVKAYVAEARSRMPDGVELTIWMDESVSLTTRINALVRNASGGLAFVLLVLALVLRFGLAIWVAAGIPIAMAGAIMLFPVFGLAISTLAVMGFLLVLGIVVDDAIVVGERIHAYEEAGESRRDAAVKGTMEVAVPVVFGVLTTIAAFMPLILVPGKMGQFFGVLGTTVVICLALSLVEAQLILPAHLAHRRGGRGERTGRWGRAQGRVERGLRYVIDELYRPALDRVLEFRYLALSAAVGVLILTGALIQSGYVTFQFFPSISGYRIFATLTLPRGIPIERTAEAVDRLERAAVEVRAQLNREGYDGDAIVRHTLSSIGKHAARGGGPPDFRPSIGGSHLAEVVLEVSPSSQRNITTAELTQRWRQTAGSIPDAVELKFESAHMHVGDAFAIQFLSDDIDELVAAAAELKAAVAGFDGARDINDSFREGKQEVKLALLPDAKPLGLTLSDLARQVRSAFYGLEVQRIQRGQDDVRVMLRYPEDERRSLGNLENMRIRTPDGTEVPFAAVARGELGRGFATIRRQDGRRVVAVTADVDRSVISPEELMRGVMAGPLQEILAAHPRVAYSLEGEHRERTRALAGLLRAFGLAILVIYALLAIPLRSYTQPLVIMAAIPFGSVGAILGHFIMNWDLVFFSMLGIVALAGVVVNDSLVLVDYINRKQREGLTLGEAVRVAGPTRFRAIMLTSATTFAGLLPLMFASSEETFFVVPIAISLAFGVLMATVITLFLVPCGCLILDDLQRLVTGRASQARVPAGAIGDAPR